MAGQMKFKAFLMSCFDFLLKSYSCSKLVFKHRNQDELVLLLCDPIVGRFKFHFESRKATNRLDKPQWFLAFILKVLKQHAKFFQVLDKLVNKYDSTGSLLSELIIEKLVNRVHAKILRDIPKLPLPFLSHYILESLKFDDSVAQAFSVKAPTVFSIFTPDNIENWLNFLKEDSENILEGNLKDSSIENYDGFPVLSSALKVIDLFEVLSEKLE